MVAQGDAWLDPAVTGRVLTVYRDVDTSPPDVDTIANLTTREVEVLRLIGQGASNQEIAEALFVSEATVKSHVGHIFAKLGLRDACRGDRVPSTGAS